MESGRMTITELADAAGISRRAVRFYVVRKLLSAPEGRARGGYYTATHLEQLRRIQELQRAGHSLEAIRQILAGAEVAPPPAKPARTRPGIQASLWTRLILDPGIELHCDMGRRQLTAEQILALKAAMKSVLATEGESPSHEFEPEPIEPEPRPETFGYTGGNNDGQHHRPDHQ
jgi:DNA-binding transcriptional MerR regulator